MEASSPFTELPSFILHCLYDRFLSSGDIASTSLVCRAWNRGWSEYYYPLFNFIFNGDTRDLEAKTAFLKRIDQSIGSKTCQWRGFHIFCRFGDGELLTPFMERWIRHAVFIKDVVALSVWPHMTDWSMFTIPFNSIGGERLRKLSLGHCDFDGRILLSHLRKISLSHCMLSHESMRRILSGCPSLEHVSIVLCTGVDTIFNFESYPNLKYFCFMTLEYQAESTIQIRSPHLLGLTLECPWEHWLDAFTFPYDIACESLTQLKLVGCSFSGGSSLEGCLKGFSRLESLNLERCLNAYAFLDINCATLKTLVLKECSLKPRSINTPALDKFEYCRDPDNSAMPCLPLTATHLLQIHVVFSFDYDANPETSVQKMEEFIGKIQCKENVMVAIYLPDPLWYLIIHENAVEFEWDAIDHFVWLFGRVTVCISTKGITHIMDEMFYGEPSRIYLIYLRESVVELARKKMQITLVEDFVIEEGIGEDNLIEEEEDATVATTKFLRRSSNDPYNIYSRALEWRHEGNMNPLNIESPSRDYYS